MNINNTVFAFLIKIIFIAGLVASPAAYAGEQGGIVTMRHVPQRSAIRPAAAPGKATFVSTSPDINQLNELGEEHFAGISSNIPQDIAIDINSNNISTRVSRSSGFTSNIVQSTQRISTAFGSRASAANATNSIGRATSSIGRSIQGATGFLSPK